MPMRALGMLLALVSLAACQGASRSEPAATVADLCVASSCGELTPLIALPEAENIHFTPEGRLFVTGGPNIYEIVQTGELSYDAIPLSDAGCSFTGMAQKDNVLFTVCGNGQVFAAELTASPEFQLIYAMDGYCIANGTALGADGNLYIVDEPLDPSCLPPDPKIGRLLLDPADPMHVLAQETWVQGSALGTLAFGVDTSNRFPNGLAVRDRRFYGTDGGSIFYVDLLEDGSAGPVTPIFFELTAHDDLSLAGDSLLVTDFFVGRIFQLSLNGELLQQTDPLTFSSPSSVQLARPPLFRPDDILVTEKGVLLDSDLPLDYLSLFRRVDPTSR